MRFLIRCCFLTFLFINLQIASAQVQPCETAFPVYLENDSPIFVVGEFESTSIGTPGFIGCNNFANIPVQWIELKNIQPPSILKFKNYSNKELQVALYKGNCNQRSLIQCAVLSDISMDYEASITNIQINQFDVFYIQIAFTDGSIGDYEIEIENKFELSDCVKPESNITVINTNMGSPIQGPFAPGETISFKAEIVWDANSGDNCQFLHGVVPSIGSGWESFSVGLGPQNFFEISSTLKWYPAGAVFYKFNGRYREDNEIMPGGWFSAGVPGTAGNNDPNYTYGISQDCMSSQVHHIYFDLTVKQAINCSITSNADLSIGLELTSDGETGGYQQGVCSLDGPLVANFGAQCCDQVDVSETIFPEDVCDNQLIEIDFKELLIVNNVPNPDDYSFVYQVRTSSQVEGLESCFDNCNGILSTVPTLIQPSLRADVVIDVSILNVDNCVVGLNSVKLSVIPNTPPEVSVSSSIGTDLICEDASVFPIQLYSLTNPGCGNITQIIWEGPFGFLDTGISIVIYEVGTYNVKVYDDLGNIGETNYLLSYILEPNIFITTPSQLCPSNSLQDVLSATPAGGSWYGDGVELDQFFGPTPGLYNVQYFYEDANGCISNTDFTIEVTLNPEVSVTAPDFVCISNSPQDVLIAQPTGGTYDPSPVIDNGMILATSPGTYTLTYRYGDPNSACNESFTFEITIIDQPAVTLSTSESEVCALGGTHDILTAFPLGGNYLTNNVNSDGEFIGNDLGINIVEYEYIDPISGCSNSSIVEINVLPLDPILINSPDIVCQGNDVIPISAYPPGGIFSGLNISPDETFTPSNIGTFTINYEYTNQQGCTSNGTHNIEVVPGSTIEEVTHPENICNEDDPIQVTASPPGGTFSGNINSSGTFFPNQIGVNNLVYTFENAQGCITDYNFSIEVLDYVIPQITSLPNPVCYSQSDVYQLIAEPAGGVFTGNVSTSGEFIPNQLGANLIGYGPGPNNECINFTTTFIDVISASAIVVDHPASLCRNSIPYDVLEPNIPGGTWEGPVTADGRFEAFDFGFNEVTYSVIDPTSGCLGSYTFEIEVVETSDLNEPVFSIPANDEYCIYEIVELCVEPVIDADDYRWETNHAIIEYATPNHLCVRMGWNALVQDEICVYPIGLCGISINPLCHAVNIMDDVGCVVISTGTNETIEKEIDFYPNPANDHIFIAANIDIKTIKIYSGTGLRLKTVIGNQEMKFNLNLRDFNSGIYFIEINDKYMERIIIL